MKTIQTFRFFRPFILFILLAGWSLQSQADIDLKFGIYASDKPSAIVRQFRPLLTALEADLSRALQEPVNISMNVARSYEEGVKALVQGKVDFARFGPASYIEAKNLNPEIKIIVSELSKGAKIFYGIICVHSDSPIQAVSELKDKRFAFGNEQSTIGRYLSQLYLVEQGIVAKKLAHYDYLGRHDSVGAAVAAGNFDAGALKESTFNKQVKAGKPLREIARFENVTKPWIARSNLDDRVYQALKQSMQAFNDAEALKKLKKTGFSSASDQDYDRIRISIEQNSRFFE